jgi:hypothetical protein
MALIRFFQTTWIAFVAAGIIAACSALLYLLMGAAVVPTDAYTVYAEPSAERILVLAEEEPADEPDGAPPPASVAGAPGVGVLPQYDLAPLAGGEPFSGGAEAYDEQFTPPDVIPVQQAGDIAIRYALLLGGGNMRDATCTIGIDSDANIGMDARQLYWRATIATTDGVYFTIRLNAYSGALQLFEKWWAKQYADARWTADGISRDALTQYEFSRATGECLLLAKALMEEHFLEGRRICGAAHGWTNTFENRQTYGSGNLLTYNFRLDDGSAYHIAYAVRQEEAPELIVISASPDGEVFGIVGEDAGA